MLEKVTAWLFYNTTTRQTVAKNTVWLFSGQVFGRLLRGIIVIYAARVLGVTNWGVFSYALSIAAFFTIFSDIGINALITRESVRGTSLKQQLLATAFFIKLILLTVIVVGVLLLFPHFVTPALHEAAALMPILVFVFAFDTLRDLGSALSRALEKMQIEASISIFTNLAIVVLGLVFLFFSPTTTSLAWAYALGSALGFVAIWYVLRDHFKDLFTHFRRSLILTILATAWPFGLLGIMGAINLNTDIVMIGWLRTPEEVGYYSAAQKMILLLYVLPALLATSLFPLMSRLVKTDLIRAKHLLEQSLLLVLGLALPIIIVGEIFAAPLIYLLFGAEYAFAIPAFRILLATLFIVYPSTLLGNAIFAYNEQKSFVGFILVSALGNFFFNFFFIPLWGIEGAAFSTLLTQLITNFLIWRKMRSINHLSLLPHFKKYLRFR